MHRYKLEVHLYRNHGGSGFAGAIHLTVEAHTAADAITIAQTRYPTCKVVEIVPMEDV